MVASLQGILFSICGRSLLRTSVLETRERRWHGNGVVLSKMPRHNRTQVRMHNVFQYKH
jgi:hypothetical protein